MKSSTETEVAYPQRCTFGGSWPRWVAGSTLGSGLTSSPALPLRTTVSGGAVGAPGPWASLIPVLDPGWAAINDFQTGNWGWGIVNTAIAASDVFLVKSLAVAVGKVGARGLAKVTGSHTWDATRKWWTRTGWREFKGQHAHHWLIPRNRWGKWIPGFIKNQPWNLMGMPNAAFHAMLGGLAAEGIAARLWFGSPTLG